MEQPIKVEPTAEQWVELDKVLRHQRTVDRKNKKDFAKTLDGIYGRMKAGQDITRDQLAFVHKTADRMGVTLTIPTAAAFQQGPDGEAGAEDEVPVDPLDAVMARLDKIESRLRYFGNAMNKMVEAMGEISAKFDESAIDTWKDLLKDDPR